MPAARCAKRRDRAFHDGRCVATSAWRVIAPITSASPSRAMPASSGRLSVRRSRTARQGAASLSAAASCRRRAALASCFGEVGERRRESVCGRWYSKAYMRAISEWGSGSARGASAASVENHSAARFSTAASARPARRLAGSPASSTFSWPTASVIALMTAGGRGDRARFAATFDAERVGRTGRLDRVDLERRHVSARGMQ